MPHLALIDLFIVAVRLVCCMINQCTQPFFPSQLPWNSIKLVNQLVGSIHCVGVIEGSHPEKTQGSTIILYYTIH